MPLFIATLIEFLFLRPTIVGAQAEYTPLQPLPNVETTSVEVYLSSMYVLLVAATTLLAVIWIVIGGIQYMSTDAYSGKSAGKSKIQKALLGLLLAGASWIILYTLNPSLVNTNILSVTDVENIDYVGGSNVQDNWRDYEAEQPRGGGSLEDEIREYEDRNNDNVDVAGIPGATEPQLVGKWCFSYRYTISEEVSDPGYYPWQWNRTKWVDRTVHYSRCGDTQTECNESRNNFNSNARNFRKDTCNFREERS